MMNGPIESGLLVRGSFTKFSHTLLNDSSFFRANDGKIPSLSPNRSFQPAYGVLNVNLMVLLLMIWADLIWSKPVVPRTWIFGFITTRSEEHTSELQSHH